MRISEDRGEIVCRDGSVLRKGDVLSLDGSAGVAYMGAVKLVPAAEDKDYQTVIEWADKYKRMNVFANAETAEDACKAAQQGAEGIGLMRTEHMFFSDPGRINSMRAMILAGSCEERQKQLDAMLPLQQKDFLDVFKRFPNKVMTVRFIDPPLHEFLPVEDSPGYLEEMDSLAGLLGVPADECKRRVLAHREKNPSKPLAARVRNAC